MIVQLGPEVVLTRRRGTWCCRLLTVRFSGLDLVRKSMGQ